MSSMIDTVGAAIMFGAVLLIVMKLNTSMTEATYQHNLRVISQEEIMGVDTLAGAAKVLEADFAKIGANASSAFVIADSNRITFKGDLDNNGIVDSVKYSLVTLPLTAGGNPNLQYRLIRRQNTETGIGGGIGVSQFRLTYFDDFGKVLATPVASGSFSKIRSIKVQLQVQSKTRLRNDIDTTFASSYWERIISPKNLRAVK